jgi:branched-chain amino acid transport system permease protein
MAKQSKWPDVITRLTGSGIIPLTIMAAVAFAAFFLFPYDLGFLTRILIMMIFVLSLDFILGYAGIVSLGHAALYGTGAYVAGLLSIHVWNEPLAGLVAGGLAGGVVALVAGLMLMRMHGLTLIMSTIAVALILQEIASKARPVTGGVDGLTGISLGPIAGVFEFDFTGRIGYWYAFAVLVLTFYILRKIVASPFGFTLRGIKESPTRMKSLGTDVYRKLLIAYIVGGIVAGVAGALAAQITSVVSTEVYNFALSADVVVMLILGGIGRLYGAIVGTIVFMLVHHIAATIDPFNWLFVIGALVLAVVFIVPNGLVSVFDKFAPGRGRGQ